MGLEYQIDGIAQAKKEGVLNVYVHVQDGRGGQELEN